MSLAAHSHATPHDFQFQVGHWNVHHRRLRHPLTGCDASDANNWFEHSGTGEGLVLLSGQVSIDVLTIADGQEGMSLRLRTPGTNEWRIFWLNSRDGVLQPPVIGSWHEGRFEGVGEDEYDGRKILVRFVWGDIAAETARWEQFFSEDGGQTWESNWVMEWTRVNQEDAP